MQLERGEGEAKTRAGGVSTVDLRTRENPIIPTLKYAIKYPDHVGLSPRDAFTLPKGKGAGWGGPLKPLLGKEEKGNKREQVSEKGREGGKFLFPKNSFILKMLVGKPTLVIAIRQKAFPPI